MFDKNVAYNQLPKLPGTFDFEKKSFLKLALKANIALAKLNGLALLIPNVDILISPLLVKESVESNAIENINTTTLKVLQNEALEKHKSIGPEKEVSHYRTSLLSGINKIKSQGGIGYNLLLELQAVIEPNKPGVRKIPGTVIANSNAEILYTPPEGAEVINDLLKNLELFMNDESDDIDPLIKMAVIHYQFESIHPFYDGNGRTGRILNIVYLILAKKLDYPILFLSEYINQTRQKYYELLNKTTQSGDYGDFIEYMLTGIVIQAEKTGTKIMKIKNTMQNVEDSIRELGMDYHKITQLLFSKPFLSVNEFTSEIGFSRQTATKYINTLEEKGIIQGVKIGRNKLIYINEFIELLD